MSLPRVLAAFALLLGAVLPGGARSIAIADGLTYVRGAAAVTDSMAAEAIVDLRFTAPPSAPPPWIATATGPVIVLLAGENLPDWLALLAPRSAPVLLLAPQDTTAAADLEIAVATDRLREVVASIDDGADVARLAQPVVAKRRFDEAALVRHHSNDGPAPDIEDTAAETATDEQPAAPPLSDPMLERAVQVLLGLRALGRG